MSRKKTFILLSGVALICLIVGFIAGVLSYPSIERASLEKQYRIRQDQFLNKPAPIVVTQSIDGKDWSLEQCRGKVVFINFWATWCGPCIQEVPELKELYNKYKDRSDFVMVNVSLDRQKEVLTQFCKQRQMNWLQLYEDGKEWENALAQAFDVQGIPSAWLIDREGNIIAFELGLDRLEMKLAQEIDS